MSNLGPPGHSIYAITGFLPERRSPAAGNVIVIRVCLVEDQTIVREGLRTLLGMVEDVEVLRKRLTVSKLSDLILESSPDIVLLDIKLPKLDGLEVMREVKDKRRLPATIILTTFDDDRIVLEESALERRGSSLGTCRWIN